MKIERKNYNTTLRVDLIKKMKFLAVEEDTRINVLMEEAIEDLLRKYENNSKADIVRLLRRRKSLGKQAQSQ